MFSFVPGFLVLFLLLLSALFFFFFFVFLILFFNPLRILPYRYTPPPKRYQQTGGPGFSLSLSLFGHVCLFHVFVNKIQLDKVSSERALFGFLGSQMYLILSYLYGFPDPITTMLQLYVIRRMYS